MARTSDRLLTASAMDETPGDLSWSADSRFIYYYLADTVWRVPAAGGPPAQVGQLPKGVTSIQISAGGRKLVFGAGRSRSSRYGHSITFSRSRGSQVATSQFSTVAA